MGGLYTYKTSSVDRTMRVVVNGCFSAWAVVLSGVPHGVSVRPTVIPLVRQ